LYSLVVLPGHEQGSAGFSLHLQVVKNKHLLLLFLFTLLLGLGFRHFPWRQRAWFERSILTIQAADIQSLSLHVPGADTLTLVQEEGGTWRIAHAQRNLAVAASQLAPLLTALQDIRTHSILESTRPDTLGLHPAQRIDLRIFMKNGPTKTLHIGRSMSLNGLVGTYIEFDGQEGVLHFAKGDLRTPFLIRPDDFRPRGLFAGDVIHLQRLRIVGDSIDLPADSVEKAKTWLFRVKDLPFADYFDESRAVSQRQFQLDIWPDSQAAAITLSCFERPLGDLPETWPKGQKRQLPRYILHSSANPNNFFALHDTTLAAQMIRFLSKKTPHSHAN
jgi:hypothetical protein